MFAKNIRKLNQALRRLRWDFQTRCQRFRRGYAAGDVSDMDVWFIHTVRPMLQEMLESTVGNPQTLTRAEWEAILREMADCLDLMEEDGAQRYLHIPADACSPQDYCRIRSLMNEKKDRFFELFSTWFYCLWE